LETQSSRQGIYKKSSRLVDGKPSWTSDSQAIWYVSEFNFWCIGALDAIGKSNSWFKRTPLNGTLGYQINVQQTLLLF